MHILVFLETEFWHAVSSQSQEIMQNVETHFYDLLQNGGFS